MLTHPTLEKLHALRLTGMIKGLEEQLQMTGLEELGFAERLGLLVDREMTERENRRLKDRLAKAMTGASTRWAMRSGGTCWKSWKTATAIGPPS